MKEFKRLKGALSYGKTLKQTPRIKKTNKAIKDKIIEITKDRKEINRIIENCLPLMKINSELTQECADAIIVYFIEKRKGINDKKELKMTDKIKEKLLKGCGRPDTNDRETLCGKNYNYLCPTCQAKLQQHEETSKAKDEEFIKILEELKNLRLYRSKSCQLLLRRIKQRIKEK